MLNTRIAFSFAGGLFGLLLLLISGVMAVNPTRDSGYVLAYTDGIGFDYDVYLHDTATGYALNMTRDGLVNRTTGLSWFPDGWRVAYIAQDGRSIDVVVRDLRDGSSDIISEGYADEHSVRVSSDGRYVQFNVSLGGSPSNSPALRVFDMDNRVGQTFELEGVFAAVFHEPHWSPDSRYIAAQVGSMGVLIQAVDGSTQRQYSPASIPAPGEMQGSRCLFISATSWMPDSRSLWVASEQGLWQVAADQQQITAVEAERMDDIIARVVDLLPDNSVSDDLPCIHTIDISPDGRWLALTVTGQQRGQPLYLLDLQDQSAEPVAFETQDGQLLAVTVLGWLQDGHLLTAFTPLDAQRTCAYTVVDPATVATKSLSTLDCAEIPPERVSIPG